MAKTPREKDVSTLTHDKAVRLNNPTAEMASLYEQQEEMLGEAAREMRVPRDRPLVDGEVRDRDMDRDPQIIWNGVKIKITPAQMRKLAETGEIELGDAQLVWRGKDRQDWSDLVVNAPPLYIQEKVHPKAIIDDLKRRTTSTRQQNTDAPDLFADFNGIADPEARAEFYQHTKHWQNRMILGDSLQVMASLAEREEMRGKVQCIYFDPPYGIKFNSNWQVSTSNMVVRDGKKEDVSREPEQVKAFRDTWKDGIHSYLTYLRDRMAVARELLTESGSIFVQISDENVHRVRAVMDEIFGPENFISLITFKKTHYQETDKVANIADYIIIYSKDKGIAKFRKAWVKADLFEVDYSKYTKAKDENGDTVVIPAEYRLNPNLMPATWTPFRDDITLTQDGEAGEGQKPWIVESRSFTPGSGRHWRTHEKGRLRLQKAQRVKPAQSRPFYVESYNDTPSTDNTNIWTANLAGAQNKVYVVQTNERVIQRCILMVTDPGDLVLDPTCGSGTTAFVAEQWGRRWITVDTSRVALALARTRLMSARYPFYLLADSLEGRAKEQEVSGKILADAAVTGDIRQGFVYDRVPRIRLKSIANNSQIDDIWEKWQAVLEPLRQKLNKAAEMEWEEWEIPRYPEDDWEEKWAKQLAIAKDTTRPVNERQAAVDRMNKEWDWDYTLETLPERPADPWGEEWAEAAKLLEKWWEARIARQKEIDASIARAADVELLYDRPYEDKTKVRVAGPFTVESLSPHRVIAAREDTLGAELAAAGAITTRASTPANMPEADFGEMVLSHLRTAGVHQQEKRDTIHFSAITPWPGNYIAAEGRYADGGAVEKRAAILIGPEFGTLTRSQITAAAREASDARFDVLIACAFNFDAQATDLNRLGPLAILKARMNPDLHMAEDLKNTGKGNLFVVFGEPDVEILDAPGGEIKVKVHGVDVFDPSTGEIRSDDVKGIAAWFIDTDYDEESFFVRHAYFLGANDPYKSLKTALKAEIDPDAWETLYSDTSRPFARPSTGRIAVKVINHFGDEVLKVFGV
ncbi:site-specific DNA-methyltransferase [Pseudorhizobium flavum]|uniref:site-specific DNA-methyltransferase (adenine-specific) n=1 Tax=Pseudorhizobium flavum TaxID=1335061 RepID=A0A7W9Z3B4_9HYPH|nr:site-specific DNA-methyltransferase [Pseudorhizobium flavum]MBB6182386.1 adenine-specific DNA-methyltransferase [Pseudorhizobium flavum]CAD6602611.1 site-specific DNA-methyltransferase [Pseudorhizobium flavum]